jgi:polynucleotide 5'-hydroxyl-kinase GRC3/NOL9
MHQFVGWSRLAGVVEAAGGGVVMIVGETDSGKTSLCANLLGVLSRPSRRLGFIDADVGQSTVGPPGTISLSLFDGAFLSFRHLHAAETWFVGDVSPAGHAERMAGCVGALATRARSEHAWATVIDTTGLFRGREGAELKRRKIEAADPQHLAVLTGASNEDRDPVDWVRGHKRVHHVPASPCVCARSPVHRAAYRLRAFRRYFAGATRRHVPIRGPLSPRCRDMHRSGVLRGLLVGLTRPDGTLDGLGVALALDGSDLVVATPQLAAGDLDRVELGSWRFEPPDLASLGL